MGKAGRDIRQIRLSQLDSTYTHQHDCASAAEDRFQLAARDSGKPAIPLVVYRACLSVQQADIPINGVMEGSDSDTSSMRRGRSTSPVRRRGRGGQGTALQHRDGSRPRPLTRMYGKGDGEMDALVKRMDRLEEVLARIEEGVKAIG